MFKPPLHKNKTQSIVQIIIAYCFFQIIIAGYCFMNVLLIMNNDPLITGVMISM